MLWEKEVFRWTNLVFYNLCEDQLPSVLYVANYEGANDLLKNKIMAFVKTHKTVNHKDL